MNIQEDNPDSRVTGDVEMSEAALFERPRRPPPPGQSKAAMLRNWCIMIVGFCAIALIGSWLSS